jgi:crotonobetainyl-CoA:carnitine CoA-transferase CaiB-like acyl-CoA transferase
MTTAIAPNVTQNAEYVRRLLHEKQPGFSAVLELALALAELEQWPAQLPRETGGFARDFATADGQRVVVAVLTRRQFADLAEATRLARTFAFLERVLYADFSARGDLYAHRATIATLLAPWFSRRTVADLAAAFTGTSVPWARLG